MSVLEQVVPTGTWQIVKARLSAGSSHSPTWGASRRCWNPTIRGSHRNAGGWLSPRTARASSFIPAMPGFASYQRGYLGHFVCLRT